MGSSWNVLVEWESGEVSWQPLHTRDKVGVYDTDPVTAAIYAYDNKLLDVWKLPMIKKYAKTHKRLIRMANQAKLKSFRTKPIYMFGVQVPRNYAQARELDAANGNDLWQKAVDIEMTQIDDYDTFIDKGTNFVVSNDYKKITGQNVQPRARLLQAF